jgi:hypothetical protein
VGVAAVVAAAGLVCAEDAAGGAMAGELAAMAAAASASGAVPLPDALIAVVAEVAGVAAGAFVDAMTTGITMATAFGTAEDGPPGCADAVGSVEEVSSEDDFSFDFVVPAFEVSAFALDCWVAVALASVFEAVLAVEACPALELSEALLAAWLVAVESEDCVLFWVVEESSVRRGGAGGVGAADVVPLLPVALFVAAALLSSRAPKRSLPCDGSVLAGRCGATGKVGVTGASDVTLNTGRPFTMEPLKDQQGPGQPDLPDFIYLFQYLRCVDGGLGSRRDALLFCPAARFAVVGI